MISTLSLRVRNRNTELLFSDDSVIIYFMAPLVLYMIKKLHKLYITTFLLRVKNRDLDNHLHKKNEVTTPKLIVPHLDMKGTNDGYF